MKEVTFDQHSNSQSLRYTDKPTIHLHSTFFHAGSEESANRLFRASISVTLAGFNELDEEQVLFRTPIVFSEFISAQHQLGEFQMDRTIQMPQEYEESHCHHWIFRIELNNLMLKENETLTMKFTER